MLIRSLLLVLVCSSLWAQEARDRAPAAPYQVEFTIQDASDASAKTARRYTLQLDNNGQSTVRSGARVPIANKQDASAAVTQWNYYDVGVNIDCRLSEREGRLSLRTDIDISAVADSRGVAPTISSVRTNSTTLVTPGKTATLLVIDDPQTQKRVRIDTMVSPIR